MNRYYDSHFKKEVVTIYPGEYYSTTGTEMISTVLGSCVSIVLYDPVARVGGINHFMLARDTSLDEDTEKKLMGKFGEYAIDLLIEDIVKKGGVLARLEAKVFGGGNIFNMNASQNQVGDTNSKFAFEFLKKLNIPVIKSDTGGVNPRKIFFDPETFKVLMKYINNRHIDGNELEEKEKKYAIEIKKIENLFLE
ncbi:MAG: chemotaxis protein CheD [Treponema sp.]|nr:chemotaxis protein CheD [Treponema sp.]